MDDGIQNGYNVKRLALILAAQAEIDGMKAFNESRRVSGMEPGYTQGDFDERARRLEDLAYSHDLQLFQ